MIERFQIEDLLSQDSSGIDFFALDKESGRNVVVRRFFPLGVKGGGLHEEEQSTYEITVSRLFNLRHPALCSVVFGACDPVDGMPYIVTEWIEGESLEASIAEKKLSANCVILLLMQAIEVCDYLSYQLGEEAVWVETGLHAIIAGGSESRRGFTFRICPSKLLGRSQRSRGLEAIAILGEQVADWSDRSIRDPSGGELGGWLAWLRKNAFTVTLQEARASLAALTCSVASPRAGPVATAPRTASAAPVATNASELPSFKDASKTAFVLPVILGLFVAVVVVVILVRENANPESASNVEESSSKFPAKPSPIASPAKLPATDDRVAKMATIPEQPKPEKLEETVKPELLSNPLSAPVHGPVTIQAGDFETLFLQKSKQVTVEGDALRVYTTKSGGIVYLAFAGNSKKNLLATYTGVKIRGSTEKEIEEDKAKIMRELASYEGKKIRVTGTVTMRKGRDIEHPVILIDDLTAIEIIK